MFSRIIGRAITHQHKQFFSDFFSDRHQLGVSVSAGAEAVIHGTRLALQSPNSISLQLDFKNAFNSLSRRLILQQLHLHFPHLIPYFSARYGNHTHLPVSGAPIDVSITSRTGIQQGDPLGPFFFALGLAAVTDPLLVAAAASQDHPLHKTTFLALLDDITITGPPQSVAQVANALLISTMSTESTLTLNSLKCVAWSHSIPVDQRASWARDTLNSVFFSLDPNSPSCFPDCSEGITLLGTPLGSPNFVRVRLARLALDNTTKAGERLLLLDSLQMRTLLLSHCADKQFSFNLRTSPPSLTADAAGIFDSLIVGSLRKCQDFGPTGQEGDDGARSRLNTWKSILQLPLRLGGMALGSAQCTAPLAYLGSVADVSPLVLSAPMFTAIRPAFQAWLDTPPPSAPFDRDASELPTILADVHQRITQHRSLLLQGNFASEELSDSTSLPRTTSQLPAAKSKLQHRLSSLSAEMTEYALRGSVSPKLKAQLLSQRCPVARAPLSAIPSCADLTAPNDVFATFLFHYQCLHLIGNPLIRCSCPNAVRRPSDSPDSCFGTMDAQHALSCSLGNAFTIRHHQGCAGLKNVLQWLPDAVINPQYAISRNEATPDFVCFNLPSPSHHAYVEYSIIDHTQDHCLSGSIHLAGSAGKKRDTDKTEKYQALCLSDGAKFYPASQETSGRISEGYHKLLSLVVDHHDHDAFEASATTRTWSANTLRKYLYQIIGINFWAGMMAAENQRTSVNTSKISSIASALSPTSVIPFSCVPIRQWQQATPTP